MSASITKEGGLVKIKGSINMNPVPVHTSMSASITDLKEGDLVKIKGINDENALVYWYGQLVGNIKKKKVNVVLLEKKPNGVMTWGDQHWFHLNTIDDFQLVPNKEKVQSFRTAWKKLGIRILSAKKDLYIEIDQENSSKIIPIGDEDDDYDSDDSDGSIGSLAEFIVPDNEGESWTPANPKDKFVQETHEAVHEYNDWVPKNERERGIKSFIDRLERKYITKLDDRKFMEGVACPNVCHPPLKRRKKR